MSDQILSYQTVGHGPRVVLALHGWFGDHSSFDQLFEVVDLDNFTWVCPAYRGYGVSRALEGDYTVDEIAADCIALADAIGADEFALVGHSMGGKAIQRVLALAPERVRALIGVAPVPASGLSLDAETRQFFADAVQSREVRAGIIAHSTGGRLSQRWIDALVRGSLRTAKEEAFAGYLRSWADEDFHHLIAGNAVRAKVIVGECDPDINAQLARDTWLTWYENCELETVSGGGHYLPDETPIALATSIQAFLDAT